MDRADLRRPGLVDRQFALLLMDPFRFWLSLPLPARLGTLAGGIALAVGIWVLVVLWLAVPA